jgi:hypothetical protein
MRNSGEQTALASITAFHSLAKLTFLEIASMESDLPHDGFAFLVPFDPLQPKTAERVAGAEQSAARGEAKPQSRRQITLP